MGDTILFVLLGVAVGVLVSLIKAKKKSKSQKQNSYHLSPGELDELTDQLRKNLEKDGLAK